MIFNRSSFFMSFSTQFHRPGSIQQYIFSFLVNRHNEADFLKNRISVKSCAISIFHLGVGPKVRCWFTSLIQLRDMDHILKLLNLLWPPKCREMHHVALGVKSGLDD